MDSVIQAIESTKNIINESIDLTEELYSYVYKEIPIIERKINNSLNEMNILSEYFKVKEIGEKHYIDNKNDPENINEILSIIESRFSDIILEINTKSINKGILLKNSNNQNTEIEELIDLVNRIKGRLSDIELISLKSLIYSAKLGSSGSGFAVISRQINEMSVKVRGEYEEVVIASEEIKKWEDSFENSINKMNKLQNDIVSVTRDNFENLMNSSKETMYKLNEVLSGLSVRIENALNPIEKLMLSIQAQDAIRQNLENLRKCIESVKTRLTKIGSHKNNISKEDELDIIVFANSVLDFSFELIENVKIDINESIKEIKCQSKDILDKFVKIEEDTREITLFADDESNGQKSYEDGESDQISKLFQDLDSFFKSFMDEMNKYTKEIANNSSITGEFEDKIVNLETLLEKVKKEIDLLSKLKILTKIELSRFEEGQSFGREISDKSETIINEVKSNRKYVKNVKRDLAEQIKDFRMEATKNESYFDKLLEIISKSIKGLEDLQERIKVTIRLLKHFSVELIDELNKIHDLTELDIKTNSKINDIKENINKVKEELKEKENIRLESISVDTWNLKSNELKAVYESLTTNNERTAFKNVFKENIGQQDEAGQLTLF